MTNNRLTPACPLDRNDELRIILGLSSLLTSCLPALLCRSGYAKAMQAGECAFVRLFYCSIGIFLLNR